MNPTNNNGYVLEVYEVALELAQGLRGVFPRIAAGCTGEADQLRRAAASVVRNIAEGSGRQGRERVKFRRVALGSAHEVLGILDLSIGWGWLTDEQAEASRGLCIRVIQMLVKLTK